MRPTSAAHQQMAFRRRQRSMSATVGSWSTWVAGREGGEETDFGIGGAEEEGVAHEQRAAQQRVADLGADAVGLVRAEAAAPRGIVEGRVRSRKCHGVAG